MTNAWLWVEAQLAKIPGSWKVWAIVAYAVGFALVGWQLSAHGVTHPWLRGLFWPIPLVRFMAGHDF